MMKERNEIKRDTTAQVAGTDYPRYLKVLVVEDNELSRLMAKAALNKIGWDLDTAENGIEAIEKLKNNHYDLVLMDIQMPEMDGIEATMRIRKDLQGPRSQTPIIAFTPSTEELRRGFEAGMNDHISKPFHSEELIAKVKALIKKGSPFQSPRNMHHQTENPGQEPVINLHNLTNISGNNPETVKNIIQVFLKQAPPQLESLTKLIDARDWDAVKVLSHKMKSSYAIIGANKVRNILHTIESDCMQNSVDEAKFKVLMRDLHTLNAEVITAIEAVQQER